MERNTSVKQRQSRTANPVRFRRYLIGFMAAFVVVGALLTLSLVTFDLKGYVEQDSFAVPDSSLKHLLQTGDPEAQLPLVSVDMGEAIYARPMSGSAYYVGEQKEEISAGYPLFSRSGQVLCFVDDRFPMVTADWGTVNSYAGLYLSDGTTFNANRTQADIAEITLVQVDGGYQTAQEMTISSTVSTQTISLNAMCAFGEDSITVYAYENGVLCGSTLSLRGSDTVRIGSLSCTYAEFLASLGLWRETQEQQTQTASPSPVPDTDTQVTPSPEGDTTDVDDSDTAVADAAEGTASGDSSDRARQKSRGTVSTPKAPSEEFDMPTEAIANPDATPASAAPASAPEKTNPAYVEPQVSFGSEITQWVYTLTVQADITDPSGAITGGVQIFVYDMDAARETQVLRQVVSASGSIVLGQLEPGHKFHITAQYSYKDRYGIPQTKTLDIGTASTWDFASNSTIALTFCDELHLPAGSTIELFDDKLQLVQMCFANIANGLSTVAGETSAGAADPGRLESYVNRFALTATPADRSDEKIELRMGSEALRLLRVGYTLTTWNTPDKGLSSGTTYNYTVTLTDRYGNEFTIDGDSSGTGHTCKTAPTVSITVPSGTNVPASTGIEILFSNMDSAAIAANTAEGAAMGNTQIAGLFLVPHGMTVAPENAIELEAFRTDDSTAVVKGKFLPITLPGDNAFTANTSWTVTNLAVLEHYTAAVLCGSYDISDGWIHTDTVLSTTTEFLTASPANLGSISYTYTVSNITYHSADLSLRMNAADTRLLALLSDFTVPLSGGDRQQSIRLTRADLNAVAFTPAAAPDSDGLYTVQVEVPVYLNEAEDPRMVSVTLSYAELSPLSDGSMPDTVWEFLLSTSYTDATDANAFTLHLGGPLVVPTGEPSATLLDLSPRTEYTGRIVTRANQGGQYFDVSNYGTGYSFTTLAVDAYVTLTNAFVSSDFIELYGLSVIDPDSCIQPDDADRGGDVAIRISTEEGIVVSTTYLTAADSHPVLRLSGLTINTTYRMTVSALKYINGAGLELNRALKYVPAKDDTDPTVFTFTTGQSVVGDLSLTGVSQLYRDSTGAATDTLSLLDESDFYTGVYQSGGTTYYYYLSGDAGTGGEAELERYLSAADSVEASDEAVSFAKTRTRAKSTSYKAFWTSRLIEVSPGDQYAIYNAEEDSSLRIVFFYRTASNTLAYYTQYTNRYLSAGAVFQVPSMATGGNANADRICYMCLAGSSQRDMRSMILEKYDSDITAAAENLALGVSYKDGMYISTNTTYGDSPASNVYNFNAAYAYTEDYLPVSGGSVYELAGRNPNVKDSRALLGIEATTNSVFFYAEDYTFLGCYTVCAQKALVKAPFGAAYCRFNIATDQSTGSYVLNTDTVSMKLYKAAADNQYLVKLRADLSDASVEQILTGGSYTVSLYIADGTVSDSEDPSLKTYTSVGTPLTGEVTEADLDADGHLSLSRAIQYDGLESSRGYKVTLEVCPAGWGDTSVLLDTVYFTTNRVVYSVSTLNELLAIKNDPAGSYLVTADITGLNTQVLNAAHPFTGTIDFQGHSLTVTSFISMFEQVSRTGVVKNLVLNYEAVNDTTASYAEYVGSVTRLNSGTLQNIIVNYSPHRELYGTDFRNSGGIVHINRGTIDGFVLNLKADVRIWYNYGGVCYYNYGTVTNGYICGSEITDPDTGLTRNARFIHPYRVYTSPTSGAATYADNAQYTSCCVGIQNSRAVLSNVFVLCDYIIESADAETEHSNTDHSSGNSAYESSVNYTYYAGLIAGRSSGTLTNAFSVGDRIDRDYQTGTANYMLDRGPAVTYVDGTYQAKNVTYFSNSTVPYSQNLETVSSIQRFNRQGKAESLYDYQWYEDSLGSDGSRFTIRDSIDNGFYPRLVLPSCFRSDAQPYIELPALTGSSVEVLRSEVYLQGTDSALATITLRFPYSASNLQVESFTVTDRNSVAIQCEVIAQRYVDDLLCVDVLLSRGSALADSSYTITNIRWTGGSQAVTAQSGTRILFADFWQPISSPADWKTYFTTAKSNIYGNYLLTEDLDFSQSTGYSDWYVSKTFYGKLNGGIYTEKTVTMTDSAGNPILGDDGQPRTVQVWDTLSGMHEIRGVGNVGADGTWVKGRDGSSRSCLMYYMYGTAENLVFRNFLNTTERITQVTGVNSDFVAVFARTSGGSVLNNCHLRDSAFFGRQYVGGLIAYGSGTSLMNCSVKDSRISNYRNGIETVTLSLGGLFGTLESSIVENCFAANLIIQAEDVYAANGVGGLGGYANACTVENCYTTGAITANIDRVGGVLGQLGGEGILTGCWSTTSVQTVSDYAGGVVGYHSGGVLANNYTASTLITRSLAATKVHRICHNVSYSETSRYDNFAFAGQFLTYLDTSDPANSIYQFGIWDDTDGATDLLSKEDLVNPFVWQNIVCLGQTYDLNGTGTVGSASGGSKATSVADGYMPKLIDTETGVLLYDQPDVTAGNVSSYILTNSYVGIPDTINETFTLRLALFSEDEDLSQKDFSEIADWAGLSAVGASVKNAGTTGGNVYYGITDEGRIRSAALGLTGRAFSFTLSYGAHAGSEGHYLDSYILSLNVLNADGEVETLLTRVSLTEPVYKTVYSIDDWNDFFSQPQYANAFENIRIGWLAEGYPNRGVIDFSGSGNAINVKANRISGEQDPITGAYPSIRGADMTFSAGGQTIINQLVTSLDHINICDMTLVSKSNVGGNNKGIIGVMLGNLDQVTFSGITVDGGSSSYVGCIGTFYGETRGVTLEDIHITGRSSYTGGLVGYGAASCTLNGITVDCTSGVNTVQGPAYTGGVVGILYGIGADITVEHTQVSGREYVGGVVGLASGNGNRPTEYKLTNVIVGDPNEVSSVPGIVDTDGDGTTQANVTVTMTRLGATSGTRRYVGGAVGYGDNRSMDNICVYNTLVYSPGETTATDEYLGGVIGVYGRYATNVLAKNVTVCAHNGYAGGISYHAPGLNAVAEDCVVYGVSSSAKWLGAVSGYNGYSNIRHTAKHCVVIGSTGVGGVIGGMNSTVYECGAIDCTVLGRKYVGGIVGVDSYYYFNYNYVNATLDADGSPTVHTDITREMLKLGLDYVGHDAILNEALGSYSGTVIRGISTIEGGNSTSVGGLVGDFRGIQLYNAYVGAGTQVQGTDCVGGLVGRYFGWYVDYYATTNRSMHMCMCGAEVSASGANVGGLIGAYTRTTTSEPKATIATLVHPTTGNFYSLLFTGSVENSSSDLSSTHYLVGSYLNCTEEDGVDSYLAYTRLWDGSTLNGTPVSSSSAPYANNCYADEMALKVASRTRYAGILTLTAEDLADPAVYFAGRNSTHCGMGFSRANWAQDAMNALYTQVTRPASFSTYADGIVTDSSLVLWLDARNNTGSGYTDTRSTVWKDLSASGNDADLYWNGKSAAESRTFSEMTEYMEWRNSALEFYSSGTGYYAQLAESLSQYLQEDYTVELIYSFSYPSSSGHMGVLSWLDDGVRGGFHAAYNNGYNYGLMHYDINTAGTAANYTAISGKNISTSYTRTAAYVVGAKNSSGTASTAYYINGIAAGSSSSKNVSFRDSESIRWRVGYGNYVNGALRVCGIRVYNRALTADELARNNAYNSWYYFGGDAPTDAKATTASFTFNDDFTVSGSFTGRLTLLRSDDGSYNGTLVAEDYVPGTEIVTRGCYYLRDEAGNLSTLLFRQRGSYGPYLRTVNEGGEYYGITKHLYLNGQEGLDASGNFHNVDDTFIQGGYRLPDAVPESRDTMQPTLLSAALTLFSAQPTVSLPGLTAYVSGVDTVNLELSADAPDGLSYTIQTGGETVLSGQWPADSRTLTMTWDYLYNFTVTLEAMDTADSYEYAASDLQRTVMTWDTGYWYLYLNLCYNAENQPVCAEPVIHMADGLLLGADGSIRSADTGEIIGEARQSFSLVSPIPLWSGSISDAFVRSFGSYVLFDGQLRSTQMLAIGEQIYTMPSADVQPGCFVTDTYGGHYYTTVLSKGGSLIHLGDSLVLPEDFSSVGIRETSCSLGYSGHMLLVRYDSGKLVAFDYLTGKTVQVLSPEVQQSFLSFLLDSISKKSSRSIWSDSNQAALSAVEYQSQVESSPELQFALYTLEQNKENTTVTDGEGRGLDDPTLPGGQDGRADAGSDEANGEQPVADASQVVVEGLSEGSSDGTDSEASDGTDPASAAETDVGDMIGADGVPADEAALTAEEDSPETAPAAETEPAETAAAQTDAVPVTTRYITVYDEETQEARVYDLEEYLTQPAETLVTQQERAETLRTMGFDTALLGKQAPTRAEAGGLTLILLVTCAITALLAALAILKRRKVDRSR